MALLVALFLATPFRAVFAFGGDEELATAFAEARGGTGVGAAALAPVFADAFLLLGPGVDFEVMDGEDWQHYRHNTLPLDTA